MYYNPSVASSILRVFCVDYWEILERREREPNYLCYDKRKRERAGRTRFSEMTDNEIWQILSIVVIVYIVHDSAI